MSAEAPNPKSEERATLQFCFLPKNIDDVRRYVAYLTAIAGFILFGLSLFKYAYVDYRGLVSAVAWNDSWLSSNAFFAFFSSGLRLTFRLAYVISFAALLFMKRWSVYLCLIAWLGLLIPGAAVALLNGSNMAPIAFSVAQLVVYCALALFFWKVLEPGNAAGGCTASLVLGLLVHAVTFGTFFHAVRVQVAAYDPIREAALFDAVREGKADAVTEMVRGRYRYAMKARPCHPGMICHLISYAAQDNDNADIVRALHYAGSPIDKEDGETNDTPLMRALASGNGTVAEYLIGAGADPLKKNRFGVSALAIAVLKGSPQAVEAMLLSGAPVDLQQTMPNFLANGTNREQAAQRVQGITLLMLASYRGEEAMLEKLIAYGADTSLKDSKGRTFKDYAYFGKNPGILTRLDAMRVRFVNHK
ncbi:MAG: ankyrin repeat domain-containing protein [Alphaproteobacteria bacterium]|nr:ankyrin repeat domain-containing protein [Alphaproteobacteria bacterium]